MTPPRMHADRLWRRLGDAQDASLLSEPVFTGVASPRRRAGTFRRRAALAALALGAAAAGALLWPARALRFQIAGTGERGAAGRALAAEARSDLPLEFSDGSTVTFRAGALGRVARLTERGAEVRLDRGRLDAHVVHAPSTVWLVHAGPFQVRVTGTRFSTRWVDNELEVALYEGSVIVDGALLGTGVALQAGQRLGIRGGVVRTESLEAAEARDEVRPPSSGAVGGAGVRAETGDAEGGARTGAEPAVAAIETGGGGRAAAAGGAGEPSWVALADRGHYAAALQAARRLGWDDLCRRVDARRLLTLGDVARYAGADGEAGQAFEALVSRFPRDRLAADAVFSLGRLELEAGRPERAARWFARYVEAWPDGPLAEQAAGRRLECAARLDDPAAAADAARAYLRRSPEGPQAALAHEILDGATHPGR